MQRTGGVDSKRNPRPSHGMGLLKPKTRSVVGLDIEPGFVAAAEFSSGSSPRLVKAATTGLGPGLFHEGEVVDVDGLSEKLRAFFREHELPKRVRLGVASQKIAVRVIELPAIENEQELEAAVRFQAQEELPMPLEQAVLDYRVLERIDNGEGGKMRVVVVGARRDTVEHLLAVARKAGLQPELVDLSAFAMIRALYVPPGPAAEDLAAAEVTAALPELGLDGQPVEPLDTASESDDAGTAATATVETPDPATLYCYVGGLTNLAIGVGESCVFNRVLQNGVESMAATLAERRGLTLDHSREWLRYVGLVREIDGLEGERQIIEEAREVLAHGASRIADEIRLSIEYYHTTVPDARRVETTVMAGPGIAIEGLPAFFERELGMPVQPRSMGQVEVRPGALDGVEAAELTVATGLALDKVPS
jgi:type IV pilus assembly protein PilM